MCGLSGVLVFKGSSFHVERPFIQAMIDTIKHRGPDGEGIWIADDKKVGFGFRRLSIIDLSTTANQPMSNAQNTVHLVFNGEIYNHAEIRKELSHYT